MERQVKKTKRERRQVKIYWKRSESDWLVYLNRSHPEENFLMVLPASMTLLEKKLRISEELNISPEWIVLTRKYDRDRVKKYEKINRWK